MRPPPAECRAGDAERRRRSGEVAWRGSMEIKTPLGDDVLLFYQHGRAAKRSAACSSTSSTLLSSKSRHQARGPARQERHRQAANCRTAGPRSSTAIVTRFGLAGGHRPLLPLPAHRSAVAVVADAHRRLPHLPEHDGAGHRQGDLRRVRAVANVRRRVDRRTTGRGSTACSTARPTSTSSAA